MIKQITDSNVFLNICDKLDYVKDCKLSKKVLYSFMIAGEYNKQTFVYASYGKYYKMTGCSILHISKDISGGLVLFVIFQWINPNCRKLWKDYMKFTEKKAKEFKVERISFTTTRSEKAIERHLGKYGYKKTYNVIEKEVI